MGMTAAAMPFASRSRRATSRVVVVLPDAGAPTMPTQNCRAAARVWFWEGRREGMVSSRGLGGCWFRFLHTHTLDQLFN